MLTSQTMGLLALGILWLNTLLVAWATLREAAGSPRRIQLGLGVVAILAGAAACTTLSLWPPIFGTVSTFGGAASLLYFLLVLPLGTALRDHSRAKEG